MMKVYMVNYAADLNADPAYPVINGTAFRFAENARAYAATQPGSKVKPGRFPFKLADFRGEPVLVRVASGGSVARAITRTVSGARYERRKRVRGARGQSVNFMRPPGGGLVNYQDPKGKREPRIYTGSTTDAR